MRYFHCPTTYNRKPYGCGAGPYNGIQAFLDYGNHCPNSKCGRALKRYYPKRIPRVKCERTTCAVRGPDEQRYCTDTVVTGGYCGRHAYLAVTG